MPVPIAKLSCNPLGSLPMIDRAPAARSIKVTSPPLIIGAGEIQMASTNGARANHALGAVYKLSTPATTPKMETTTGRRALVPLTLDNLNNILCPNCGTLPRRGVLHEQ